MSDQRRVLVKVMHMRPEARELPLHGLPEPHRPCPAVPPRENVDPIPHGQRGPGEEQLNMRGAV